MWGKLVGAVFGFMFMGPFGALIGIAIGHQMDRGLNLVSGGARHKGDSSSVQQVFFDTTFAVMGYLAKVDGRVSEKEIQAARQIMQRMRLNATQKQGAIAQFTRGKQSNFDFLNELAYLQRACHGQRLLLQMFVEIQFQALQATGHMSLEQRQVLETICQRLHFQSHAFYQFETGFNKGYSSSQYSHAFTASNSLKQAYDVLGVSSETEVKEIKRAYRRLMSQHHPDKLVAKGLPEEMLKLATEKTQQIQAAYEKIRVARNF